MQHLHIIVHLYDDDFEKNKNDNPMKPKKPQKNKTYKIFFVCTGLGVIKFRCTITNVVALWSLA